MEDHQEPEDPDDSISPQDLERATCLGDLSEYLGKTLIVGPVVATAIVEHVFQELIKQFYERGVAYLPNFGWIRYKDGEVFLESNAALQETTKKMKLAIESESFALAAIELMIKSKLNGS